MSCEQILVNNMLQTDFDVFKNVSKPHELSPSRIEKRLSELKQIEIKLTKELKTY